MTKVPVSHPKANPPQRWSGTLEQLAAATGISAAEISDAIQNRASRLRNAGLTVTVERTPGKAPLITVSNVEKAQDPAKAMQPDSSRGGWTFASAIVFSLLMALAAGFVYLGSSNTGEKPLPLSAETSSPKQAPEMKQEPTVVEAESGDVRSQTELADRYREGKGVPQDDKAAMTLYREAAMKGDPVAQHRLGLALSSGTGVATDRVAAYVWLVMAKNGGQAVDQKTLDSLTRSLTPGEIRDIRYQLGSMFERGIGCVPDLVFADEWFLLGAAAGDARSEAESAALEQRMSPEKISRAHARSNDWLRRHTVTSANNASGPRGPSLP